MELTDILALKEAGVDLDGALRRLSGSTQLYERFLMRFPGDQTFDQLSKAIEAGDIKEACAAAHTLKGLTANLGMDSLFAICSSMVDLLRSDQLEEAGGLFPDLKERYQVICGILKKEK